MTHNSHSYAIVVCDNGLGHVRRCCLLAKRLMQEGHRPTLLAPLKKVRRIKEVIPYVRDVECIDFSMGTSANLFYEDLHSIIAWLDRLPSLSIFDKVICDNLPEILSIRSDAVLSAQFFWHDVIINCSLEYLEFSKQLLNDYKPKVFGCEIFSTDSIRQQPGFIPVGLYKNPVLQSLCHSTSFQDKTDLLITGGSTDIARESVNKIVNTFLRSNIGDYSKIYTDKQSIPKNNPEWLKEADFTPEMFCRLKRAICRPGLGILTDLITVGIKPEVFHEAENLEMVNNTKRLIDNKMGRVYKF